MDTAEATVLALLCGETIAPAFNAGPSSRLTISLRWRMSPPKVRCVACVLGAVPTNALGTRARSDRRRAGRRVRPGHDDLALSLVDTATIAIARNPVAF
jgi:hypothetical protein